MHNPLKLTEDRTQACVERLRRLPAELQPPYNWQEFQRRSQSSFVASGGLNWWHLAAAAAFLLVVCGIAFWGRVGSSDRRAVEEPGYSEEIATHRPSRARGPVGDLDALRGVEDVGDGMSAQRARAEAVARDAEVAA